MKTVNKNKEEMIKTEKINMKNTESKYHKYLGYLVIFSIIGLILEFAICVIQRKIFNKEAGLILGTLSVVYGLGAIITIVCLERFKSKKIKLFICGTILGGTIEYFFSFILETIFGAKLWNCWWSSFNINGRVCLEHALLWGFMTIVLINILKKYIDKIISKIRGKIGNAIDIMLTIFMIGTITLTLWGIITYVIRARETLNGKNYTSNNNIIEKFQNTVFSNEIMEKLFSKLEIIDNEGNTIFIKDVNGRD